MFPSLQAIYLGRALAVVPMLTNKDNTNMSEYETKLIKITHNYLL